MIAGAYLAAVQNIQLRARGASNFSNCSTIKGQTNHGSDYVVTWLRSYGRGMSFEGLGNRLICPENGTAVLGRVDLQQQYCTNNTGNSRCRGYRPVVNRGGKYWDRHARVIMHLAKLSIDWSLDPAAKVHFFVFNEHVLKQFHSRFEPFY